ncbi:MAG TPA: excisionase family DNA-binding protein [Polaromonas sp.]|nr:excisionase family DNA-binding protein [Polaromonas sp.]
MKTSTTSSTSFRNDCNTLGSAPNNTSPYVSATETKAIFAASLAGRKERLEAGDMLTTDEAAELVGTTRVTVNAWIAKGRAIGLTQTRRGYRLPKWQFEPQMWEVIPHLSKALDTVEGWAMLTFLETPMGALQGQMPRQVIERGDAAYVLKLAAAEGTE